MTDEDVKFLHDYWELGVDTETDGLNYRTNKLLQIQFCNKNGDVFIVRRPNKNSKNVIKLLDEHMNIFHHAGFDIRFIYWHLGIFPCWWACTKMLSKLTSKSSSSLGKVIERITKIKLEKAQALSNWDAKQLTHDQIKYAAEDVLYLHVINDKMKSSLTEEQYCIYSTARNALTYKIQIEILGRNDLLEYEDNPQAAAKLTADWKKQRGK